MNKFSWAFTGLGIYVLGLLICGLGANVLIAGDSAIDSLASTIGVTCVPFFIALFVRTKLLPGSALYALPKRIPIAPVSVVSVGATLMLVIHQFDTSVLRHVAAFFWDPQGVGEQVSFN